MSARSAFAEEAPLLTSGSTGAGTTQASFRLEVRVRNCPHVTEEGLRHLLELELATLGGDSSSESVDVRVDCVTDAMIVSVEVGERPVLTRRLVGDPALVSERKVSLSASELVADLWASVHSPPEEDMATPEPTTEEIIPDEGLPERAFLGLLGLEVMRFVEPARVGVSGLISGSWRPFRHFQVGASLSLGTSRVDTEFAEIQQTFGAFTPHLRLVLPVRRLSLFLGVAVPLGFVNLSPSANVEVDQENAVSGTSLAVLGELGGRFMTGERLFLQAAGGVGGVLIPVTGTVSGESLIEVDGLLVGGHLAMGTLF